MKTIVIGAGEVGFSIAQHLINEQQDVVLVDTDAERLRQAGEALDVQTIHGHGSYPDILESAGCHNAGMLIAVTDSDETNMVACQMAYSLFDVPRKIARVRQRSYLGVTRHRVYTPENMPVDVIISPEIAVSDAILRMVTVPGSFDAEWFANDRLALIGVHIGKNFSRAGVSIKKLTTHLEVEMPFRLMVIFRKGRLIVPCGADHLEVGDEVFFLCRREDVEKSMKYLGFEMGDTRRVFVNGGGNVGFDLCHNLEEMDISTRLLEKDLERAEYLADQLGSTTVLHGNGLDRGLLAQENIGDMDVFISVTADDAVNIFSSLLAKEMGARSAITLVNSGSYHNMASRLGLEVVVSPREITASKIIQFVRRGRVASLHSLHGGRGEVAEVEVAENSPIAGIPFKDIEMPAGTVIGAVCSSKTGAALVEPNTIIHAGDRVVLFSAADSVHEVEGLV